MYPLGGPCCHHVSCPPSPFYRPLLSPLRLREKMARWWLNSGPASQTLTQNRNMASLTSRVVWAGIICFISLYFPPDMSQVSVCALSTQTVGGCAVCTAHDCSFTSASFRHFNRFSFGPLARGRMMNRAIARNEQLMGWPCLCQRRCMSTPAWDKVPVDTWLARANQIVCDAICNSIHT